MTAKRIHDSNKIEKLQLIICSFVSFCLHIALCNTFTCWFSTDTDGYWLHAATFLGNDWSGVAKNMTSYYSWGYSVLLMIPMILSHNPVVRYYIAVVINAVLCSLIVPISYKTIKTIYPNLERTTALFGSFIISVYSTYFLEGAVSLSECFIYFLTISILGAFVQYVSKKQVAWGITTSLLVAFCYIVHNRNIGIVIAFCISVIVFILQTKKIKDFIVLIGPLVCGYLMKLCVDHFLAIKENTNGIYTKNTYDAVVDKYVNSSSAYRVISVLENITGEVWYSLIGTCLVAGVGIFFLVKEILFVKNKVLESKMLSVLLFTVLSWLGSVGVSALFMMKSQPQVGGRIDHFIYGRYMEGTVGALMLFGFLFLDYIKQNDSKGGKIWKVAGLLASTGVLSGVVYRFTLKCNPRACNWFSVVAILFPLNKDDMKVSILETSVLLGLIGFLVVTLLLCKSKLWNRIAYIVVTVVFIFIGWTVTFSVSKIYADGKSIVNHPTKNQYFTDVCDYVSKEKIEDLYIYTSDGYEAFSYQFMNPTMHITGITNEDEIGQIEDGSIILVKLDNYPDALSAEVIYSNDIYMVGKVNQNVCEQHVKGHSFSDFKKCEEGQKINILWLGTSIPKGNSYGNYPALVEELLGENVTIYNISKSAAIARSGSYRNKTSEDPYGFSAYKNNFRMLMKSFSLSTEQKQKIYDDWDNWSDKFSYDGNFDTKSDNMELYLSCSYDSDLKNYLEKYDIDYVIYDAGYNDVACNDFADTTEIANMPKDWADTAYYIGASEFIFDKIHEYSPNTQIVVAGHYSNKDYPFISIAQERLADICNVPIYKTWQETGWTTDKIQVTGQWVDGYFVEDGIVRECTVIESWCPDGIHPGNDYSQRANNYLADIHARLLKEIIYK